MAASNTDMFMKVGRSTATTLSAPGYTVGDTSINVGSTTNWPTTTGITFAIDTIGSDGLRVAGTYNTFRGTVNSATQITNVVYVGGDANQNYSAGTTTRVYILAQSDWANRLVDGLLVSHDQDGTLKALTQTAVSSAVNEVSVTSSVTGEPPTIAPSGSDTNIGLLITGKGSGNVVFTNLSAWVKGAGTWTYASATTITIPSADTSNVTIGTKIWITQTTSKFFSVVGISGTTITVTGGSDYTVANAAITAPYYSNAETPAGFPDWFNRTPTISSATGTITTSSGTEKFRVRGRAVEVSQVLTITTNGTGGTALRTDYPTGTVDATNANRCFGVGRDSTVSGKSCVVGYGTTTLTLIYQYDNAYPASSGSIIGTHWTYLLV